MQNLVGWPCTMFPKIPYSYGKSNSFFCKSETWSGFLSKTLSSQSALLFFQNSDENRVKIKENLLKTYLMNLPSILEVFFFFWSVLLRIKKKEEHFEFWSQNCKKMNFKIWPPIGLRDFGEHCARPSPILCYFWPQIYNL